MKQAMVRMSSGALLTYLVSDLALPAQKVLTPAPPWGTREQEGVIEAVEPFGPEHKPYMGALKVARVVET